MAPTAPLPPAADQALVDAIAAGPADARRRAMAKAITLFESSRSEHRRRADALLAALPVPKGAGRLHFGSAVDPAQSAA